MTFDSPESDPRNLESVWVAIVFDGPCDDFLATRLTFLSSGGTGGGGYGGGEPVFKNIM